MLFNLLRQDDHYALYEAAPCQTEGGDASLVYFLTPFTPAPLRTLPLLTAWQQHGQWALIMAAQSLSAPPSTLAEQCGLTDLLTPQRVLLVWWASTGPQCLPLDLNDDNASRLVAAFTTLTQYNWTLSFSPGSECVLNLACDAASSLTFNTSSVKISQIQLGRDDFKPLNLPIDTCSLLLESRKQCAPAGTLCSGVCWNIASVFQLGQDLNQCYQENIYAPEVRYFQEQSNGTTLQYRYPLFASADINSGLSLPLAIALNPSLPQSPEANYFKLTALKPDVSAAFTISSLYGLDGQSLNFVPHNGTTLPCDLGFYPVPSWTASPNKPTYYLAPTGTFRLSGSGPARLMPGLSALEYLTLQIDDLIEWRAGGNAFGTAADESVNVQDGKASYTLSDLITTSWMRVLPANGMCRYFAQAHASVFYASSGPGTLPSSVNAELAQLDGTQPACPITPYGMVFNTGVNDKLSQPTDLALFEKRYLAGLRGTILADNAPVRFVQAASALISTAATPSGLLATLNSTPSDRLSPTTGRAIDPPAGSLKQINLANGWYLAPNDTGMVDSAYANALMQPELCMVFNRWERPQFCLKGAIQAGGFAFVAGPVLPLEKTPLLITKLSGALSLFDMMQTPDNWRNSDLFVSCTADAKTAFSQALKTAKAVKDDPLFEDFLTRIVYEDTWTGFLLLNASVDGELMPAGLDILLAGIDGQLTAHHVAVDLTDLRSTDDVISQGKSSIAAVISYNNNSVKAITDSAAYAFTTESLQVGIKGSAVTLFKASVGVTVPQFFGRPVVLKRPPQPPLLRLPDRPNCMILKGNYQNTGSTPTVVFSLDTDAIFDFGTVSEQMPSSAVCLLNRFDVSSASVVQCSDSSSEGLRTLRAQICLNGALWFTHDPFGNGLDLLSYGNDSGGGLQLRDWCLNISCTSDATGAWTQAFELDYTRISAAGPADSVRPNSLLDGLPLTLKRFLAAENGLTAAALGGQTVHCVDIAGKESAQPQFALQFELLFGSLGSLSSVHAALALTLNLAWGPSSTIPEADGINISLQLPGASAGFKDLSLQGFIKLVFGDANLMRIEYTGPNQDEPGRTVFALLCNNVALSLLGYKLPPKVVADLILFSDPSQAAGSNLAGCIAVQEQ